MSKAWSGGSTRRYRKARAEVLARDRNTCQNRIPGVCTDLAGGAANQAHHLDGKAAGDDPARMVASCGPCNRRIGDPTKTRTAVPAPRTEW